jgi:PAS domain S-box-containing protein
MPPVSAHDWELMQAMHFDACLQAKKRNRSGAVQKSRQDLPDFPAIPLLTSFIGLPNSTAYMKTQIRALLQYYSWPLVALFFSLLLTWAAYFYLQYKVQERRQQLFLAKTEHARERIHRRLEHYIQILRGGKGFFSFTDQIGRQDWKNYIEALEVYKTFPGIQGIGFAQVIPAAGLAAHERRIRAEGFPGYAVRPAGPRDIYTAIVYLEPFRGRNLRAFGYDMFSEPVRRQAMIRARDTGQPVLTGKVKLVQETSQDVQPGFLVYLPVYRNQVLPASVQERRRQLRGYVYSPFRAYDLMENLFQSYYDDINIQIYDGRSLAVEDLLYDKSQQMAGGGPPATGSSDLVVTEQLRFASHAWTLRFSSNPDFNGGGKNLPKVALIGGLLISGLIFVAMWLRTNTRHANRLKQIITDNSTAALFMVDTAGNCTFMNPAAVKMTGYTFEEIRQRPLHDMIHHHYPDGTPYPIAACPIDQALRTNKGMRAHEDTFLRKDGSFFQVSCAITPVYVDAVPVATVIEVRDITDRKEAERKLQENAGLLHRIFLEVPAIVALIRASDQVYILANPMYSKLHGERVLLGRNIREANPDLQGQGFFEVIGRVIRTGQPFVGKEVRVTIQNPAAPYSGYFNLVVQPLFTSGNQVDAVLLFAVEVTELVQSRAKLQTINEELTRTNQELRQTNTDLDNFVYTASHDLKAPISNLEGLTHDLEYSLQGRLKADEKMLIHLLSESINKLKRTIMDLTEITKVQKSIDAGGENIVFADIYQDVLADLQKLIAESAAQITTDFAVTQVHFARKNLRSILYNLLSNALKYRSPDRPLQLDVSTRLEEDFICLIVADNGLGIRQDQQHKLFTMFKRVHTHVEGSGIGLYIIKRIIENNGGHIVMESAAEQGTVFRVYFPR